MGWPDAYVVAPVRLHVIVEVHARRFPFAHLVTLGGKRLQRGPVQLLEQLRSRAETFAKSPLVQERQQFPDGLVQFCQREETLLAYCSICEITRQFMTSAFWLWGWCSRA